MRAAQKPQSPPTVAAGPGRSREATEECHTAAAGHHIGRVFGTIALLLVLWPAAATSQTVTQPDATKTVTNEVAAPPADAAPPASTAPGATVPPDQTSTENQGVTQATPVPDVGSSGKVVERNIARDASRQPRAVKATEANQSCAQSRPPTGRMLAVGTTILSEEGGTLATWAFILGAATLLVTSTVFLVRTGRLKALARTGPLETASIVIGITAAIVGLAVTFIPGVGVGEHPPPEATMSVREVHPRITHGSYDDVIAAAERGGKRGSDKLDAFDRREIGNLVWLELRLAGYRRRQLALQWAEFDRSADKKAFIPGTSKRTPLRTGDSERQTVFLPVWVGYPNRARFEVQFRLLDGDQVRQLSKTGLMRAAAYRYVC